MVDAIVALAALGVGVFMVPFVYGFTSQFIIELWRSVLSMRLLRGRGALGECDARLLWIGCSSFNRACVCMATAFALGALVAGEALIAVLGAGLVLVSGRIAMWMGKIRLQESLRSGGFGRG